MAGNIRPAWICAIFLGSGASALMFETLWFHQAGLALGNSVWASSLVLAAFMGGLGLGNAWAALRGDRVRRPLRLYALAEVAIAVTGVALVYALPILGRVLAPVLGGTDAAWLAHLLRLGSAFILLLVPAAAMGATLPLLTRVLSGSRDGFGVVLGRLYGWNTLGAVIGVVVTEAWAIGALGIRGTALAAGAFNLGAALVAVWLAHGLAPANDTPRTAPAPLTAAARPWLAAVFFSGFALLALEVVWFRFLALFVESRSLAFALLLGVVLCGIALGGLAASTALRRFPEAWRGASAVAFGAGALALLGYTAFPLLRTPWEGLALDAPGRVLALALPLILPVSVASGVFFTFAGAALRVSTAATAQTTGRLTLSNTMGAALGSLAAGFLLLPGLGMENAFFVLALVYAGIGVALARACSWGRRATWVPGLAFVSLAVLFPFGAMQTRHLTVPVGAMTNASDEVVAVREGLLETLVYVAHRELGRVASFRMITDSYSMSANMWFARRYMDLYVTWPVAVHPQPRRALLISFGVGVTAKALTETPDFETIDVVDISPDVLEMSDVLFETGAHPLHDPRVRVHVEDGRHFLQTTQRRFDLITGEPPPPQMAGVVNLYSREYFALAYDRLAEGGIVTYWLPLHSLSERAARSVLRGFCDVFSDCSLWHGAGVNLMMVGTRGDAVRVSAEHFARQWRRPRVAAELLAIGVERPEQLGALFIGDGDWLNGLIGDAPALVDDRPKRILARASDPSAAADFARRVHDTAAARERFLRSETIGRLWPNELRDATLPYFDLHRIVQRPLLGAGPLGGSRIEDADHLLRESSLEAPILWLLGSDGDRQRIVDAAEPRVLAHPQFQLHRGIRRLAERRNEEALAAFVAAEREPRVVPRARPLRLYTLGLLGRIDEARSLAATSRQLAVEPQFWAFLSARFGIERSAEVAAAEHP